MIWVIMIIDRLKVEGFIKFSKLIYNLYNLQFYKVLYNLTKFVSTVILGT